MQRVANHQVFQRDDRQRANLEFTAIRQPGNNGYAQTGVVCALNRFEICQGQHRFNLQVPMAVIAFEPFALSVSYQQTKRKSRRQEENEILRMEGFGFDCVAVRDVAGLVLRGLILW